MIVIVLCNVAGVWDSRRARLSLVMALKGCCPQAPGWMWFSWRWLELDLN